MSILTDPAYRVPPVPDASRGVAWLRASVARFSSGEAHRRRRALVVALLDTVPPESLRGATGHPVAVLARALELDVPVEWVADVAQAYQPGTGDETRADDATDRLVARLGGAYDEATAARIGLLVQACAATVHLAERARTAPLDVVLRDDPPAPATRRLAPDGTIVRVPLAGDLAFGAGPHACPGRPHALALASGAHPDDDTARPR
ncbi:hypothetical protein [Cryptosporangium arvum]|uniref:hypothetical protein n=1 Tax=Cryptosporangium arvum TaxID=80871 RepID=UPI0004BB276F|nr:hypothetical protein [Cryptosporangium arvum]